MWLFSPSERELNINTFAGNATVKTTDRDGRLSEWVPWVYQFKVPSEHTIAGKQMDVEM